MARPVKGARLGGGPAHEYLLLANLAASLFRRKSLTTTESKARRLRPVADRLINLAKRDDLHARRRVLGMLGDREVVNELFGEIAPLMIEHEGSYTRITRLGLRKIDNVPLVRIELLFGPDSLSGSSERAMTDEPVALAVEEVQLSNKFDRAQVRVLAELNASSRDELSLFATSFGMTIRSYGRDSRYGPLSAWVVGVRSLREAPAPPALLQITRTRSASRNRFTLQLAWLGTEPILEGDLLQAISLADSSR